MVTTTEQASNGLRNWLYNGAWRVPATANMLLVVGG